MVIVCDLFYQTNDGECPKKYLTPCSWHFYLQMMRKNLKEKKKKEGKVWKMGITVCYQFFLFSLPTNRTPPNVDLNDSCCFRPLNWNGSCVVWLCDNRSPNLVGFVSNVLYHLPWHFNVGYALLLKWKPTISIFSC